MGRSNAIMDKCTPRSQQAIATSNRNLSSELGYYVFIYLFGVLRRFQHCTGHITTGSWKGRGNQYIQFVRVLYCKLPTNGKQLPAFPLEAVTGIEPRPQRWEARVLPLCQGYYVKTWSTPIWKRLKFNLCKQYYYGSDQNVNYLINVAC